MMERLTQRHYHANDYYMTCSENCNADIDCIDCTSFEKLVDRLGAYEDTGLTPDEVNALKASEMGKAISEIKEFDGLPIQHLIELAKADKESRVLVLPCKLGDTVWRIEQSFEMWPDKSKPYIKKGIFFLKDLPSFGTTVFLTREEAEEALRRDENG